MDAMDKRPASPSSRTESSRPRTHRKRSNSFPISEALGCSTPEAELILAEGRAAVRSRLTDQRRHRPQRDRMGTFRPQDHIGYLSSDYPSSSQVDAARHTRTSSNATDRSTSTLVAQVDSNTDADSKKHVLASTSLGDYSAHLAKFVQSQLNSIPAYKHKTCVSPRSCPDLSSSPSQPQSPAKPVYMRRHVDAPCLIEIPAIRPPARSAFSAWSSTDDETDGETPPIPDAEFPQKTATSTPSVLCYYEHSDGSTFFTSFTSTPLDDDNEPGTAKASSFQHHLKTAEISADPTSPAHDGYPQSALSRLSMSTSSSAPSISSVSTRSYFEYKMPTPQALGLNDQGMPAVTPPLAKVISAISPFEGTALANVHDILVESQQRVLVDGMSFDMVRDLPMPHEGMRRVHTPC